MKVTAFVKYDLYPHYIVLEGDLQENFDVKTSCGTYKSESVIFVKPVSELEKHKEVHTTIRRDHDRLLRQLKIDLIKQNGIDFINTDKF